MKIFVIILFIVYRTYNKLFQLNTLKLVFVLNVHVTAEWLVHPGSTDGLRLIQVFGDVV